MATIPPAQTEELLKRAGMPHLTPKTITDLNVLWEELAVIRTRGYAVEREEVEDGLVCLAAPVKNYRGETVAAVRRAGPIGRILPFYERYGRNFLASALEISTAPGFVLRTKPEISLALS